MFNNYTQQFIREFLPTVGLKPSTTVQYTKTEFISLFLFHPSGVCQNLSMITNSEICSQPPDGGWCSKKIYAC